MHIDHDILIGSKQFEILMKKVPALTRIEPTNFNRRSSALSIELQRRTSN